MTLFIDSTDYKKITFSLKGEKLLSKTYEIDPHKSHETLAKLEDFLKSKKLKLESIKKIIVNKGPGSYTGVRVSLAHAMGLALALRIPLKVLSNEKFLKTIST